MIEATVVFYFYVRYMLLYLLIHVNYCVSFCLYQARRNSTSRVIIVSVIVNSRARGVNDFGAK